MHLIRNDFVGKKILFSNDSKSIHMGVTQNFCILFEKPKHFSKLEMHLIRNDFVRKKYYFLIIPKVLKPVSEAAQKLFHLLHSVAE